MNLTPPAAARSGPLRKGNFLSVILLAGAFSAAVASAEPAKPKDNAVAQGAPAELLGKAPKGLKTLAEYRVIAQFDGAPFRTCRGATGLCPERCDGSGEFATFLVKDYLFYSKRDKDGDDRDKDFHVRISDFHKKPTGDQKLNEVIAKLNKGDLVLLEWKHLYGRLSPGAMGPVRPVLHLKKISLKEADALRAEAKGGAQ